MNKTELVNAVAEKVGASKPCRHGSLRKRRCQLPQTQPTARFLLPSLAKFENRRKFCVRRFLPLQVATNFGQQRFLRRQGGRDLALDKQTFPHPRGFFHHNFPKTRGRVRQK